MLDPEPTDVVTPVVIDPRSAYRAAYLAQDGLVLAGIVNALDAIGLCLGDESSFGHHLGRLSDPAYGRLRVVLRALAAQGWLTAPPVDRDGPAPRWTEQGAAVAAYHGHYVAVGQFLGAFANVARGGWAAAWDTATPLLPGLLDRLAARWGTTASATDQDAVVAGHLDGALLIPALLADAADGTYARVEALRATVGYEPVPDHVMPIFGLAGSYLPVTARLSEFLSGAADDLAQHVDREPHARWARAAHTRYDQDLLSVVLDLFSRPATGEQPRFVADVECGDGSRLRDIYQAIRDRTVRGTHLEAHPVTMVGIDVDPAALLAARILLKTHQVPAVLIEGSVGDPDAIAARLAEHGLAMNEGLHVRAFADHTRRYLGAGDEPVGVPGADDGAYVDEAGHPVSDTQVERDLVEHLRRWVPYVRRYGLAVVESHTVAPHVARRFTGRSQSVALDALQCLTHRYPVGHDRWLQCCRAAGLETVPYQSRRYPAEQPFVAASLNRLLPVTECIAPSLPAGPLPEAAPPPEDGRGLHELLFAAGDTRRPRPWAAHPTGWIIAQALRTIERRIATGSPGQVIRVLDYGAGTGLCAIELLKALAERHTDRQITEARMAFELHLVDIRTPWFDYGERLLSGHPSTRFHDLRGPDGRFRTMAEIMGQDRVDMVLASMVFHLIQPRALTKVADDLARLIAPGGTLLWSAPDVGPTGPEAFLFHDANRAIRRSVLTPPIDPALPDGTRAAVARIHEVHSAETEKRAGRRILPTPNDADVLAKIFDTYFIGNVHQQNFEILPDELLDTLLVPSNAEEYFPELPERASRENVIRTYWARVVPLLRELPGGTATGLSLKWTFGKHSPRERLGEDSR